jgi:hypothetical protein
MNKKISDIMDCVEYYPLPVHEQETQSAERIVNMTMKKVTAEKVALCSNAPSRVRRGVASVAIAAVLVAAVLSVSAFAVYRFSLRDMEGPTLQIGDGEVHALSLNRLKDSPEYEAAQEWEDYVNMRFAEGENMAAPDLAPDAYSQYNAYSPESKDALNKILSKYDLKMHNVLDYVKSLDGLYSALGISGFMPVAGNSGEYPINGSVYDDGSFTFNCAAELSNGTDIRYQFYRLVKGAFTRIGYPVANAADFEEWVYATESGVDVLLAIGENKSAMAVNLDNSIVFANILSGTGNNDESKTSYGAEPVEKSDLEEFADSFDLPALK